MVICWDNPIFALHSGLVDLVNQQSKMDDDFCMSQNQDTWEVESISTPTTGKFTRIASY